MIISFGLKRRYTISFDSLLPGRCFTWSTDPKSRDTVWIKLDKNRAQDITDDNRRIKMKPSEAVVEVSLIEQREVINK